MCPFGLTKRDLTEKVILVIEEKKHTNSKLNKYVIKDLFVKIICRLFALKKNEVQKPLLF